MVDPEYDVIDAIAHGDGDAFERLVKRYQNPLFNFINRYLGDRQGSEDLVQETFLRVYRAARRFEPRARVSSWIFRIAYNLALNEIKRRCRFLTFSEEASEATAGTMAGNPFEAAGLGEMREEIATAMAELPENQRAALLLRVDEGMSYREIGDVMGLSAAGVESLIFRARRRLKDTLKRD
jgi:RNA polymerase sigma-70 factor, ECF subfamily